jgi:hypothetical protein
MNNIMGFKKSDSDTRDKIVSDLFEVILARTSKIDKIDKYDINKPLADKKQLYKDREKLLNYYKSLTDYKCIERNGSHISYTDNEGNKKYMFLP